MEWSNEGNEKIEIDLEDGVEIPASLEQSKAKRVAIYNENARGNVSSLVKYIVPVHKPFMLHHRFQPKERIPKSALLRAHVRSRSSILQHGVF